MYNNEMNENITNATNYPPAAPLVGEEQQRGSASQRRRRSYNSCCCPTSSGSSGDDDGLLQLSDGMVRAIFLLLGIGILIPWNAFVNAKPYFTARLCQRQSQSSGHQAQHDIVNFEQWFGLVWNVSSVLSLGLIIASQSFSDYWNQKDAQSLPSNVDGIINDNANAATPTHDSNLVEEPNRSEDITSLSSLHTHSRARTGNNRPTSSSSSSSLINGTRSGRSKNRSSFYNVVVPLGLYTVVFSIQAVLVTIPDISPTHFLIVTLLSLAVCGTCGAIATAGIVSTAGQFAPNLGINPFFSGQALGGAAVALANFAASALGEDPEEYLEKYCGSSMTTNDIEEPMLLSTPLSGVSISTKQRWLENNDADSSSCSPYKNLDWAVLFYFLAGCIVLFLCIVGYQKVHQYQNTRHRYVYETVGDRHGDRPVTNCSSSSGVSYHDESPRIGLELNDRILRRRQQMESTSSSENENDDENQLEQETFHDETEEEYTTDPDNNGPTSLLPVIRGPAACIFLTFAITLSIFPSWVSELKSSHECENQYRLDNDLYVPLSFVVFNIGDLLGRLLSGYIPVQRIRYVSQKLVMGALLRTLFLPSFLLCSTTIGGSSESSSMVIRNDFFSLAVQLLFAISNGLLISTSFLWFSQLVGTEDSTLHKRASDIMTFSLSFGLLCGSFLAFPLLRVAAHLLLKQ
mmetsp:Transcript_31226/g.33541  ORF Transcript_31226/g.33541 Transcript_31226/m.33541 type:complete len:688 (-) Transcript_31226:205-2268(-)